MASSRYAVRLTARSAGPASRQFLHVGASCAYAIQASSIATGSIIQRSSRVRTVPLQPSSLSHFVSKRQKSDTPAPEDKTTRTYSFDEIKSLSQHPEQGRLLIDVREISEHSSGHIPSSLNIPITSSPDALLLPPEDFEDRFGFEKPGSDTELVFYCKAGVRSKAAAKLAKQAGYGSVGEYTGWADWVPKGGDVSR